MASLTIAHLQTSVVSFLRPAVLLFVALIFSTNAVAQTGLPRDDVALDIILLGTTNPAIRLALSRGFSSTQIRREQLMVIDANAAGDFASVSLAAEHVGDAIRITLFIFHNESSNPDLSTERKARMTASYSYLLHEGESIRPAELTQLGIEPFELKVMVAKARVLNPGAEFPIVNNTTALTVERLEGHLEGYRLWLKNTSSKNVMAFNVAGGRTGFGAEGRRNTPAIAAGATSDEIRLGMVDGRGITITFAVFEDGTFEGDARQAAPILAKAEGMKIQAPDVLRKIDQTLGVSDNELVEAFDKTESELWLIPEAIDKPSALELLKIRFPSLDEKTWRALYEDLKGGLYDARNIALADMGVSRRSIRERQRRIRDDAEASRSLRATLEEVKHTLEGIISGKQD
jgi:hypothetical protein